MNNQYSKYLGLIFSILFTSLQISCMTPQEEHDVYFRKNFCDTDYRKEVKELPQHLVDACFKSGIDPATIHVYKENNNASYAAHTIGRNICLTSRFDKLDEEQQAWYFAHELSHVKHRDTEPYFRMRNQLNELNLISTGLAGVWVASQLAAKRWGISNYIKPIVFFGMPNIIASYFYYQKMQDVELRANEEASIATSPDAGISVLKECLWRRDYGSNSTMQGRLNVYKSLFGFNEHASLEKELAHLEAFKKQTKI